MNVYTDVYKKSVEILKTPSLAETWAELEKQLKALLQADGPNESKARALDDLRKKLRAAAKIRPLSWPSNVAGLVCKIAQRCSNHWRLITISSASTPVGLGGRSAGGLTAL